MGRGGWNGRCNAGARYYILSIQMRFLWQFLFYRIRLAVARWGKQAGTGSFGFYLFENLLFLIKRLSIRCFPRFFWPKRRYKVERLRTFCLAQLPNTAKPHVLHPSSLATLSMERICFNDGSRRLCSLCPGLANKSKGGMGASERV